MPTGKLSGEGKTLWEKVYNDSKAKGDSEEIAARKAWSAVKSAGWHKDKDGTWVKSSLTELSLVIKHVGLDDTGQMNWRADCSDIETDSYDDNMTLSLYEDFINRIGAGEKPPAQYCSEFWAGGTPYLSISHYSDFNGEGVPGVVTSIYVDGKFLKAKGYFNDTPLGRACFKSLYSQLHNKSQAEGDKVRISIGFLDWAHKHKESGVEFVRESLEDTCPECMKEIIHTLMDDTYQRQGKFYLKGHLIHLALTRVPVNKRTLMEVDKSMTTQKEDAASIVGEELAEDLEKKAKEIVGKSEALVEKSEDETPPVEAEAEPVEETEVEEADAEVEDAIHARKDVNPKSGEHKYGDVTFADPKNKKYPIDTEEHIRAAWNYINKEANASKYSSSEVSEIKGRIIAAWKRVIDKQGPPSAAKSEVEIIESLFADVLHKIDEKFEKLSEVKPVVEPVPAHPLDKAFSQFKVQYDSVSKSELPSEDKLRAIQDSFNALGLAIRDSFAPPTQTAEPEKSLATPDLVAALSEVMRPVTEQLQIVSAQLKDLKPAVSTQPQITPVIPKRLSIPSDTVKKSEAAQVIQSATPKLHALLTNNLQRSLGH